MASKPSKTPDQEREQRIREQAYQLWQADGAPEGAGDRYWFLAEELIEQETKTAR